MIARSPLYDEYQAGHVMIGPSLLAADFRYLAREIERLEAAGARFLHLDIMDGHFVPNLSFGVPIVQAVRRATPLILDVHLMISNPEAHIERFREAGADYLTVHIEVAPDPRPLFEMIHRTGACAGVSLNPPTPVETVIPYLNDCELVLVMSVMPGFGGQSFRPEVLPKIRRLRQLAPEGLMISVDGGVNGQTIGQCAEAGATMFIVGTGLLGHDNYSQRYRELAALVKNHQSKAVV
ncbi:ribulose-phosphate 3-epimerase [Thermogutta sp.]|uniref:ribulose-phosphate 3-epimerase n=1 Tax=Thermogutta sp. TaxID=1962930 RepID=UPI00321FA35C